MLSKITNFLILFDTIIIIIIIISFECIIIVNIFLNVRDFVKKHFFPVHKKNSFDNPKGKDYSNAVNFTQSHGFFSTIDRQAKESIAPHLCDTKLIKPKRIGSCL